MLIATGHYERTQHVIITGHYVRTVIRANRGVVLLGQTLTRFGYY